VSTLLQRVKIYDDGDVNDYLATIAGRVGGGARVTVIEDPTLGAFGMPGGRVFVQTGLLASLESEAQVALVVAREAARDGWTVGARKTELSTVAMSPTAAAMLGRDLRLAASAAIDGAGSDGERVIDARALSRLTTAGYDARDAATVFRRLAA